jgi:hypothetical protein
MWKLSVLSLFIFLSSSIFAQARLQAHFNPDEYRTFLQISERQIDTNAYTLSLPWPANYKRTYISPVVGLDNRFEVWLNKSSNLCVLSIRGTTTKSESWLENFTSGMLPAEGKIKLDSTGYKSYKVAANPNAYVHSGWMLGMLSMADDMVNQMRVHYKNGYRNFVIFGHSQGGAIAFLFRSHLEYMSNPLPADITLKTYCSAAPKPGNIYYAYDFAHITQGGWGLRVVNSLDWVPEVPFATQTIEDINEVNPFNDVDNAFRSLKPLQRMYVKGAFKKMKKSAEKSRDYYIKYLGNKTFELVENQLPGSQTPDFAPSFAYVPAGTLIVLVPGQAYKNNYLPKAKSNFFIHHMMYPYWLASLETFPERG